MTLPKRKFAEFDLAKAIAILGLPFVHFLEEAGLEFDLLSPEIGRLIEPVVFFTVFGPAIFMICMGFGLTGSYSYKRLRKNGIQFLIIGYLINLLFFALPMIIYKLKGGDETYNAILVQLLGGDIYVFVGWFYILFSSFKKYKLSDFTMLMISALLLLANTLLGHNVCLDENGLTTLLGNFISVNDRSYFPLAGWTFFPVLGVTVGNYIKSLSDNDYCSVMRRMLHLSVVCLAALWGGNAVYGISCFELLVHFTETYLMDVHTACLLALISGIVISALFHIYNAVRENFIERFLLKLSSIIMSFYIVQWLLVSLVVYYGFYLLDAPENVLNLGLSLGLMFAIWVLSVVISSRWGYSISRFVIAKTDYTRWFNNKKK